MERLKNIEAIAYNLPDLAMRIALVGAVYFAMEHKADFTRECGTYGLAGLKKLLALESES